jgi:hypothetical protein
MNKRLVAVLVALGLVLVIFVVNTVFNRPGTPADVCTDFITAIKEGKTGDSYAMFSDTTKESTTEEKWGEQVDSLKVAFIDGALTKKSSTTTSASEDVSPQTREIIDIKSGGSTYSFTCFITDSKLDGFTSQPVYK